MPKIENSVPLIPEHFVSFYSDIFLIAGGLIAHLLEAKFVHTFSIWDKMRCLLFYKAARILTGCLKNHLTRMKE